ncbi:MAG: tetratricopeptide repeat protein [Methylacidiphilales bacterium]|nr:tetratricopeptide repeat protein [Candidatus Methylacidiphilales bacterium]MDW8349923.1 tetratricopeptide repeat protein [Verrucomicrobiae bacterium]
MSTSTEWIEKGNDALAVGELHEAVRCYERAIQLDSQNVDAWQALAMAHYKLSHYSQAAEAIQKAIALNTNDPVLWTTLSMIEMKLGHIEAAESASAKSRILSWGGKLSSTQTHHP